MQSLFGERLRKLQKYTSAPKTKFELFCFHKSVAGDPGELEIDWRLLEVESIQAFPGTVELEPAKTHMDTLPYKHYNEKLEFTRIRSHTPWERSKCSRWEFTRYKLYYLGDQDMVHWGRGHILIWSIFKTIHIYVFENPTF